MVRNSLIMVALLAPLTLSSAAHAENIQIGKLECDVSSGFGAIIGSRQDASCVFNPSDNGGSSKYLGTITSFGLDVGEVTKGRLIWLVYAPSRGSQGTIEGTYRGVGANASLGVGIGANALVNDGKRSITLQPFSIEGEQGVNLAVGVDEFKLRMAPGQ